MAIVLKKKWENKCFFIYFFLSVEMFGIADFQGHFRTFLNWTSSTEEVSEHIWFYCMSMCGLVACFNCAGDPYTKTHCLQYGF